RGKWFVAWLEEIPGVNTQGRTLKEVKENLTEAAQMVLAANRELLARKFSAFNRQSFSVPIPA
ncbi:MAG: type II toxin-antitoxin system HicB family antitoxin, partial [Patescibacteria group bacterium]